ncbi:MAG TPA: excinuclease ABC subunit C [Terracidiphilus sp.]
MPGDALTQSLPFDPANARAALAELPHAAAVFALYGAEAHAEPYIGRTPNLRARLERLLQPSPKHPRRLQLAGRVRRIAYRLTGSEFESLLTQFSLLEEIYGVKSLDRMHLGAPAFIRYLGSNAYPRITITHRPSQREADWAYGPFSSRAAAERFADEALKLFLLRRCTFDLDPDPTYPGCVYSEMKMCLAPCYQGCTDERYSQESSAVEQFLATRGESRLVTLRTQRDQASADLEFEAAAQLHAQAQRVEAVRALAPELVRPLSQLRAVILQASATPDEVAVFLFENGRLSGPAAFSTLGMRIQNEQSGSSSLFAQPMALEPIPEEPNPASQSSPISVQPGLNTALQARDLKGHHFSRAESTQEEAGALAPEANPPAVSSETIPQSTKLPRNLLESRLEAALASLTDSTHPPSGAERQGHLALLKRWYYRPEVRRTGEIFFPDSEGRWPAKQILRGIGRVAAKMLTPAQRT